MYAVSQEINSVRDLNPTHNIPTLNMLMTPSFFLSFNPIPQSCVMGRMSIQQQIHSRKRQSEISEPRQNKMALLLLPPIPEQRKWLGLEEDEDEKSYPDKSVEDHGTLDHNPELVVGEDP
jgi:hypothetical protein